jgi:hypothetical protein
MVACERCKSELPADAVFCTRCGRRAVASWATIKEPDEVDEPAHTREPATGNAFSTVAVFFGVIALLNMWIGVVALVFALAAHRRREPSSRFAIAVAGVGSLLGIVFRILLFDELNP